MAYAKTSERAEKRVLREKMRDMGLDHRQIAVEFMRRYRLRPRTAWREAHGLSQKAAAERINAYAGQSGLDPDGVCGMTGPHLCETEMWPGAAAEPTGRRPKPYMLSVLAAVYGCTVLDLIDLADREHLPPGELLILEKYSLNPPGAGKQVPESEDRSGPPIGSGASIPFRLAAADDLPAIRELREPGAGNLTPSSVPAALPASPLVAYGWVWEPDAGGSGIEREVRMSAHEGSGHAERAERRDIGEAMLEQLRADVTDIAHEYMTGEPFPLFREMRRARARIYAALDQRLWPRDGAELYFLVGGLNGLMANAAQDLGYPRAADELARAGWAYAVAIDHRPLMGFLRGLQANVAYWQGRPRQASYLAHSRPPPADGPARWPRRGRQAPGTAGP